MKEKSVKNLLRSNKNAAPAEPKRGKGDKKSESGTTAAPVLPKAKAKDHEKKGKGKGKGKSMSSEAKKDGHVFSIIRKREDVLKARSVHIPNPKHKRKLDTEKGKGKGGGKAARSPSPKRDRVCYAWREGKCTKGDQCKCKHSEATTAKASAPAPNAKEQPKAKAKPKAAAPAVVRKVHLAMPAITVKRATTSEVKKKRTTRTLRKVKPRSRLCITIVMQKTPRANLLDGQVRLRPPRSTCGFRKYLTTKVEYLKRERGGGIP